MPSDDLLTTAEKIIPLYTAKKLRIITAESCTGGLVAAALTSIAGSSAVFERGYITYANQAKIDDVDVPVLLLEQHGAVSEQVALAMAQGALGKTTTCDVALSITGIAGPGGDSAEKPVGLVYIALTTAHTAEVKRFLFEGDRACIRHSAALKALSWLYTAGKAL